MLVFLDPDAPPIRSTCQERVTPRRFISRPPQGDGPAPSSSAFLRSAVEALSYDRAGFLRVKVRNQLHRALDVGKKCPNYFPLSLKTSVRAPAQLCYRP